MLGIALTLILLGIIFWAVGWMLMLAKLLVYVGVFMLLAIAIMSLFNHFNR